MKNPVCRPISLTCALTKRRVRVSCLTPGAALVCAPCTNMPVVGYWFRQVGHLTVATAYVPGTMPLAMRTAAEEKRTSEEMWLTDAPAGIQEIDLTDCRTSVQLLQPRKAA